MEPLILVPSRNLWTPSRGGGRPALPRALPGALLERAASRVRLPHYLGGDQASGDTLAVFTPQANQPPSSGYATFAVRNGHLVLEMTAASTDTAIFAGVMPRNYSGGGLTVYLSWCMKTATSGTQGFDITFERDNDTGDVAADHWQTAQTVTAVTVPGTAGTVKVTSVAITAGAAGTASIAAGDPFRMRVRNLSTGTATGNAQLISAEIKET